MNVNEKLLQVQQKLKAPKGQYNKFGKYNYRSCEDIQEAVKHLLLEVKAILTVEDELLMIGSRYYIKATARFTDVEDGSSIHNTAYARESESRAGMDEAQVTGSCSSYARKYALNGLFCIDDAKDPDYPMPQPEDPQPQRKTTAPARQQKPATISSQELATLHSEAVRTGTNIQSVCDRYQVRTVKELSPEQYRKAMSVFAKMPDVRREEVNGQYRLDDIDLGEPPFR